jgi:MYXO-CTERM domain-containing protein
VDPGEECDDGNNVDGDGCSSECESEREPSCGDDNLDPGEECDDGNNVDGDGCSSECEEEEEEPCDDEDGDGVCDEDDRCPGTELPEDVPTSGVLNPNHSAITEIVGDPIQFTTALPNGGFTHIFTIEDTGGCSCEQILDEKPGNNEGQYKFGCSFGTMKNAVKDAQEEAAPANEPIAELSCNMGQTGNAPAWAFLGLVLAAVGRRRRS